MIRSEHWTIKDIAAYFNLRPRYVADVYVHKPTFPKPVVKISQKTRAWDAEAVKRWASKGA